MNEQFLSHFTEEEIKLITEEIGDIRYVPWMDRNFILCKVQKGNDKSKGGIILPEGTSMRNYGICPVRLLHFGPEAFNDAVLWPKGANFKVGDYSMILGKDTMTYPLPKIPGKEDMEICITYDRALRAGYCPDMEVLNDVFFL